MWTGFIWLRITRQALVNTAMDCGVPYKADNSLSQMNVVHIFTRFKIHFNRCPSSTSQLAPFGFLG
jgi:hypothetical protein